MRKAIQLLVGVAVSGACLYFATRGTDWATVGDVLASARPGWIAAVVAASVTSVWFRALRWRVLLRPVGTVPVYPAFSATAIGFGASAVLPFRVGEFVRPALLARHTQIPVTAALSSVVLERLLDIVLVIACFLVLSLVYPIPGGMRHLAWVAGAGAGLGFATLVVVERQRTRVETLLDRLIALLPARAAGHVRHLVSSFLDGLGALRDLRTVGVLLAYSVYVWGCIITTFLFSLFALAVPAPSVPAALATVVSVAVAVFLPQAPGFVGTWQTGCVVALGIFGVQHDLAVGYSLFTWIVQMTINIALAGFFLAREDVSVGQVVRLAEHDRDQALEEAP